MAIVTMKKLTLLGLDADKDSIFDALVKSGVVHLQHNGKGDTLGATSSDLEKLLEQVNRVEDAIRFVSDQATVYNAENKKNKDVPAVILPKNSFARPKTEIDCDYLLNFGQNVEKIQAELDKLAALRAEIASINSAITQNRTEYTTYLPYKDLPHPSTWFVGTEYTIVQLCQAPASEWANLEKLAETFDMVELQKLCGGGNIVVFAAVLHKSQEEFLEKATVYGLTRCNLHCEELPMLILQRLDGQYTELCQSRAITEGQIAQLGKNIGEWKIYVDYLNLCVKKLLAYDGMDKTVSTFVLTGFYPEEEETTVIAALEEVQDSVIFHFDQVQKDEFAPTLTKNNSFVRPFEFVTNMYTPPNYHEIDPNPVMSVFYFIIFGLMVADIGYGLVLALAGLFATFAIKQRTGLRTLLQMFGICGVSAVAVGALFGSFFAYPLYDGIIPDPAQYPMVMMILSLMVGITHIMAGIACKMAVKIKQKQVLSAWLADFPWLFVFLGLILAIWNAALDMAAYAPYDVLRLPKIVTDVGLYVCLGSLAVGLVGAGIGTKGILGKLIKSFGSAYGIISYFSDVMSYIRVFGLMLSSALIGSVVNQLGQMVLGDGGVGYALAALVLVFAHVFNLAMGVLSVYIHNGRLAYVEFFNKFYTGEGTLFVPFGSDTKYTLLKSTPKQ